MTVDITILTIGADINFFDLYSNIDNFTTPFETDVPSGDLISTHTTNLVPDYTTVIRAISKGNCEASIDVVLENTTTTTTTSSTTTTTTELPKECIQYRIETKSLDVQNITYLTCQNETVSANIIGNGDLQSIVICANELISISGECIVQVEGPCTLTTTTTI